MVELPFRRKVRIQVTVELSFISQGPISSKTFRREIRKKTYWV